MKKVLLLTLSLGMVAIAGYSQKGKAWSASNANPNAVATDKAVKRQSFPTEFKLFELDAAALKQDLFSIVSNASSHSTVISIPNADGQLEAFEIVEASNFEPALQAQFPDIRAFSGKSLSDPAATIKLSYSPEGIQTMVFRSETANEFIEPYSADHTLYAVYRSQRANGKLPWTCTTEDVKLNDEVNGLRTVKLMASGSSAGNLKTLRLAQSCNGEYANYFGATSSSQVALVLAAFNATLTRCNGVFEKDLAIHLNLIANTSSVIYYNPSTDPYTTLSNWNLQLQQTLTSVIGSANYDIGHMFGASGGGGNAGCIGCVCVNPSSSSSLGKGSGITSPADGIPQGDNFDIDYVAHEMGHQLGANHTFSMSLEGTGQNKEIGSGITIMGYAGITSQDVAPHSIDIFHETSIAQIQANLASKTCPVTTSIASTNTAPTITLAATNYTIPISTPFALTASATDAQGDALTYCWEQNDNSTTSGTKSVASTTKTTGPNWLSFSPTTSPTRLFPQLSTILAGGNITGPLPGGDAGANIEALSSVSRTLNFRLTVRDNHAFSSSAPISVAQTAFSDVIVNVTSAAGPFAVTAPNSNVTWAAGNQTVTWSVAGTTGNGVNCSAVKILLSTDGGQTFPTVLAASTANDGSEVVTIPNTPGTTNRIKVESIGNIFFDISNTNFTISGTTQTCNAPAALASSNVTETSATVSWGAVSGAVSYDVDYKATSSSTWINAATATSSTSVNLSSLSSGTTYDWRVRTNCSSGSSSYTQAQFTTNTVVVTCNAPTGLSSSNITENSATVSWNNVGADSYNVSYKANSSSNWSSNVNTTSTSYNISGLSASTIYDWRVSSVCGSTTGSPVQSQFTTSASTAPTCPGTYDGNNNGSTGTAAPSPFNTDIYGLIEARGDNDYYAFTVASSNTAITATLSNLVADYQMALLNSSGTTLQTSANAGTANETITRTVAAGTYYVRIYPKNNGQWNANNCYTLNVSNGTGRMSDQELIVSSKKMSVSPNPVRSNVNVSFVAEENGNATISLIDQTGAIIATKVVPVNNGINNKNLFVGNVANGMYYIKLQTGATVQMSKVLVSK